MKRASSSSTKSEPNVERPRARRVALRRAVGGALVLGALAVVGAAYPFGSPLVYPTGGLLASSTTLGHFNDDDVVDVAVTNHLDDNVSIMLGNGAGGFTMAPGSPVAVGFGPIWSVADYFDGDDDLDLAVVNYEGSSVSILLGDGQGGLTLTSSRSVGLNPGDLVSGRFDGDNDVDLAVLSRAAGAAVILLGDGLGGFTTGSLFLINSSPVEIVAGHFDQDADLDLAATNAFGNSVSVFLGDGLGGFVEAPASPISVGTGPGGLTTGHFDADADLDLAVTNGGSGTVSILLGDGQGGFVPSAGSPVPAGTTPKRVTTIHLDGDGDLDLAVTHNTFPANTVTFLVGDGQGGFTVTGSPVAFGGEANSLVAGLFDDDLEHDLAVSFASGLGILLGASPPDNGELEPAPGPEPTTGMGPQWVTSGFFDDDTDLDLVVANRLSDDVTIQLGNGDGSFTQASGSPISLGSVDEPYCVKTGHFDDDGHLDLAVANAQSNDVSILLGNGQGGFTPAAGSPIPVGAFPHHLTTGRFDDDDELDLAVACIGVIGRVFVLLGNGDGTFAPPTQSVTGTITDCVTTGRFDDDDDLDLAVISQVADRVSILLGDGAGGFTLATNSPFQLSSEMQAIEAATGRFDGDADLDIAVMHRDGTASILLGNGDGTFATAAGSPFATGSPFAVDMTAGHFDGDAELDLAVTHFSRQVAICSGNGDGSFAAPVLYPDSGSGGFYGATAGCFDDDTALDLAVLRGIGGQTGKIKILLAARPNSPPVADAGDDRVVECTGARIALDGSGSSDLDEDALTFSWSEGGNEIATGETPSIALALGSHTITLIVADPDGETSTDDVIVQVVDTTAPGITLLGANPMTVECHGSFVDPGATALDACDGPVSVTVSGVVDANHPGTYELTYSAGDGTNDAFVTRTVVVTDTTPPAIAIVGANPMTVECHTSFVDPGATALDACFGTVPVTVSGTVDADVPGTYTLTYAAEDLANHASATRTVVVTDTTPPAITIVGANPMTVECHTSFVDPGATAVDACSGSVPVTVSGTVDADVPGTYTVTYEAGDGANDASATRTVVVTDTTAPTIVLTTGELVLRRANHKHVEFRVPAFASAASDGCDSAVELGDVVIASVTSDEPEDALGTGDGSTVDDIVIAPDCKGVWLRAERAESLNGRVYTITLAVRDASGLLTTATRQVVVPIAPGVPVVDDGAAAGYAEAGCNR